VDDADDYVEGDGDMAADDDDDDYDHQFGYDPDDYDANELGESRRRTRGKPVAATAPRRSGRTTNLRKRPSEAESPQEWRGERRSSRVATRGGDSSHYDDNDDGDPEARPRKRSRMSSTGTAPEDETLVTTQNGSNGVGSSSKPAGGASRLKPNERLVEAVTGKKKSKFWYYAVEGPLDNGSNQVTAVASPAPAPTEEASHPEEDNGAAHKEVEYDARSISSMVNGLKVDSADTAMAEQQ
jgi:hypothetical protein